MKIAVVTGASSGIGESIARHLAKSGWQVLAGVRKPKDHAAWKSVAGVEPIFLDVTSDSSVREALEHALPLLKKAKAVHLVNNAGIAVGGPLEAVSMERWKEQFEVNVLGLVRATQAFLPAIRRTQGRIVNISSISGQTAYPYLAPYAASKFAVEAISDSLRRELRQFGCSVISIEPGAVDTPIWKKSEIGGGSLLPEFEAVYRKQLIKFQAQVATTVRGAISAQAVAEAVEKALSSPRPKARYVVANKATHLQVKLAKHLPDSWIDAAVARFLS